jgi:hypothetical protein
MSFTFITPAKAKQYHDELNPSNVLPLSYWIDRARMTDLCEVCESEPVWRWGQGTLCFSCTTGEADNSDDYEISVSAPVRSRPRSKGRR